MSRLSGKKPLLWSAVVTAALGSLEEELQSENRQRALDVTQVAVVLTEQRDRVQMLDGELADDHFTPRGA